MTQDVLQVRGLHVYYHTARGPVKAVDDVTFSLRAGDRLGLAGESGSGKSTLAMALMRLVKPPARIEKGEVWFEGHNLLELPEEEVRALRLSRIALVPQGSMNSLNPVIRISAQIADGFRDHGMPDMLGPKDAMPSRVRGLLEQVGLAPDVAERFPHELSGGMKQRVCIAISIALRPSVIIADEPTSALDVVVQKQVMETLLHIQTGLDASVIVVGHDMGLMARFATRLGIMYAGSLVEIADVQPIFQTPLHPYTRLLIESLPSLQKRDALRGIPGTQPSLLNLNPTECAFASRCPFASARCRTERPALREVQPDRWAACHLL